jgi:hypothetical protein
MECLLDFMYKGSIDVAEENLPSLIKTATDLEIRGLSGDQKTQENSRNTYTRVETRTQRCQIETREIHTTEYIKDPFLPKQSSIDSIDDHVKVEEIEVEDDPMVISHEDSFDELPRSPETQIVSSLLPPRYLRTCSTLSCMLTLPLARKFTRENHLQKRIPPPMYKRETRFKGQKRVSVGRMTRHSDPPELKPKDSSRESNHEEPIKFNDATLNALTLSEVSDLLVV